MSSLVPVTMNMSIHSRVHARFSSPRLTDWRINIGYVIFESMHMRYAANLCPKPAWWKQTLSLVQDVVNRHLHSFQCTCLPLQSHKNRCCHYHIDRSHWAWCFYFSVQSSQHPHVPRSAPQPVPRLSINHPLSLLVQPHSRLHFSPPPLLNLNFPQPQWHLCLLVLTNLLSLINPLSFYL